MEEGACAHGKQNTDFVNCCVLYEQGQITTSLDIEQMSIELMKHEKIFEYTTIWQDTIRDGAFTLTNTNKLIHSYEGMTGLKTGSTSTAGFCLSATASRDGLDLIAVVMGSTTSVERNADVVAMLNYGFANYANVVPTPDQPIMPIAVELGAKAEVLVQLEQPAPILVEKARLGTVEKTIELLESVQAPACVGVEVGMMLVSVGG